MIIVSIRLCSDWRKGSSYRKHSFMVEIEVEHAAKVPIKCNW